MNKRANENDALFLVTNGPRERITIEALEPHGDTRRLDGHITDSTAQSLAQRLRPSRGVHQVPQEAGGYTPEPS